MKKWIVGGLAVAALVVVGAVVAWWKFDHAFTAAVAAADAGACY